MLIERFPDDLEVIKSTGYGSLKLTGNATNDIRALITKQKFAVVKSSEVDILELYTQGTEMMDSYTQLKNSVVEDLRLEIKSRCAEIMRVSVSDICVSYFISRCTEGYHVDWHSDHKNEKSCFSIPIYINEGRYMPESGMLEFCETHVVMEGSLEGLSRYPTRTGYGAVISALNGKFSHRALPVKAETTRYMLCFSVSLNS